MFTISARGPSSSQVKPDWKRMGMGLELQAFRELVVRRDYIWHLGKNGSNVDADQGIMRGRVTQKFDALDLIRRLRGQER